MRRKVTFSWVIKLLIASETLFWSSWNLFIPVLSIFIIKAIPDGSLALSSIIFTVHLAARIIGEIIAAKFFDNLKSSLKMSLLVISNVIMAFSYVFLIFVGTTVHISIILIILGLAFGISNPLKLAILTNRIKKRKATQIWGTYDVYTLTGMAVTALLAGGTTSYFGFQTLFSFAAFLMMLSVFPYLELYPHHASSGGQSTKLST